MLKLSIIIPVYNTAPYLCMCLDSVLGQTLREIEVICVDDGSVDESAAILAEYAAKDARVRVLFQANAGQGAARNRGLEQAKGEYVYFMDADDELAGPNELSYLVGEMERDLLEVLFFDAETRIDPGVVCERINAEDYIRIRDYSRVWSGQDLFVAFCAHRDYTVSPCLVIFRRDFLTRCKAKFAEGVIHEDDIFMLRVILSASRASHRQRMAYVRYAHEGSTMTKSLSVKNLRGYVACYRIGQEILANDTFSRAVRHAVRGRSIRYRHQIWKFAHILKSSAPDWEERLSEDEHKTVMSILRRNRFIENVIAAWCCLQDRGIGYTILKVLGCRQLLAAGRA